ncbi:MAG TPA: hypothetical protein VFR78_17505 [Pyrinomonadaceae bacterium]|nr:hypothetical protein [Pyrinomonadaceae bacterium]
MNCESCNTTIDYRFLSNCSKCGTEVRPETVPQAIELPEKAAVAPQQKRVSWMHPVASVFYVLISSVFGMVSGAVVMYFTAGVFFAVLLSNPGGNPSENCARGAAIAMLSILFGAFLGTVGGSAFATRHCVANRAGN